MELKIIQGEELKNMLTGIIRSELNQLQSQQIRATKLLTRSEVAEMFQVSLVTIHSWMESGILPFYKMNGKTYFKEDEVLQAMKQVKIKRKNH